MVPSGTKKKTKTGKTVEQVDFEALSLATWDKEGIVSGHRKVRWGGNGEGSLTPETLAGQLESPTEGSWKHQF